jgi:uncharacterized phage protein (TIGR02218 family)
MRDIGTLAAHVVLTTTTLAVCWKIVTQAGIEYGFTACSRDLEIDGLTYWCNTGMEPTAVECAIGLSVDNSEIVGFLQQGRIQEDKVRAGLFDGATVYKFLINYNDLAGDTIKLLWGVMGEVQIRGTNQFTAEMRGGGQWLSGVIVPLTQATCRATFGDEQCKFTVRTNNATVTSVTDRKTFICTGLIGARADGFFDYGYLTWLTGDNAGLRHDVRHYNQATGAITLMAETVIDVSAGDTLTVREGCAKTKDACKSRSNIINYDGEPDIPGNDLVMKIVRAS